MDSPDATFIMATYLGKTDLTHDLACRVLQQNKKTITREPGLTDTLHAFSK